MSNNPQSNQRLYTIEDLECVLEQIPYEVRIKDKEGRHIYINQRGMNKIGLQKDEIIGKTDEDITGCSKSDKCEETDKKVFEKKEPVFYEDKYYGNKDEHYRVLKFPIMNKENVKFIGVFSNEYSSNRQINEEIEKLSINNRQNTEEAENKKSIQNILDNLKSIIKCTNINLLLIDKDKKSIVNYQECSNEDKLFDENTQINISYEDLQSIYNEKLDIDIDNKLNSILKDKYLKLDEKARIKVFPLKLMGSTIGLMYIYYKDNKLKHVTLYDGLLQDTSNNISRVIINMKFKDKIQDKIFKFEEQTKNLKDEKEKLEEAIASETIKVNFLENMSHEFRTPINIILMTTKLLLASIQDDKISLDKDKTVEYLKILKQNGHRVLRLVSNILDTTKLDNNYEEVSMNNHNIINVIEDVVLSTAHYIQDKNKTITFDTEEEEVILACNPDAIEKIMLNLISNSLKFTEEDGEIDVDIKVNYEQQRVYVHLRNDGPCISKEYSQKIFDRFVQLDNNLRRGNEGSGIGLYLAKQIVEVHGGKIWLNTEFDDGAEFIFYLPIKTIDNKDVVVNHIKDHSIVDRCKIEFSDVYNV